MKYAIFTPDGLPLGFYSDEIHGEAIPVDAVRITDEQWREFIDNAGRRRWVAGEVVPYEPPPVEQQQAISNVLFHPHASIWFDRTDQRFNELLEEVPAVSEFLREVRANPRRLRDLAELFRAEREAVVQ